MSDTYDFPENLNEHFPAHGWTTNSGGVRMLRFPIVRLYGFDNLTRRYFVDNKVAGVWLQSRSPERTLKYLTICLRDLHREIRAILPLTLKKYKTNRELTRWLEGHERSEILLISAFTLLRRIADDITNASRPFLFVNWKRAPIELKKMIKRAKENDIDQLKPIFNKELLLEAYLNHTHWFDLLRANNGIRDILMHRPHILNINASWYTKSDGTHQNLKINATLSQVSQERGLWHIELFPIFFEIIDGLCAFMETICKSVALKEGYQREDCRLLTGMDNDSIGFWPPIGKTRGDFPVMD